MLEIDFCDGDRWLAIQTMSELEAPWKKGSDLSQNHSCIVMKLGDASKHLINAFTSSCSLETSVVGTGTCPTPSCSVMDVAISRNNRERMASSTLPWSPSGDHLALFVRENRAACSTVNYEVQEALLWSGSIEIRIAHGYCPMIPAPQHRHCWNLAL